MQNRLFALVWLAAVGLAGAFAVGPSALARPVLTSDDAAAEVLASGFARVAKAEATSSIQRGWDVWASKDGIAYIITIDAGTGLVLAATPAVADD